MQAILIFLIKAILSSGLFFLYYWLVLRNRRLHIYNRFYLLAASLTSVVIPFIHISWFNVSQGSPHKPITLLQTFNTNFPERTATLQFHQGFSQLSVIAIAYSAVSVSLLLLFVIHITRILHLKRSNGATSENGLYFIKTQSPRTPFSFFNLLFWNNSIDINTISGQLILRHELVHINQKHTLDKLFMQLLIISCWINPFYWLIQKELAEIHEFLADEGAIADSDTEAFALMLLHSTYGSTFINIIHPFFHSSIKRRLTMLTKTKNTSHFHLRRFMAVPLLGGAIFLFSFTLKKDVLINKAERQIVLVLDAGHGGKDNGAVNANGLKEKDLNLKITKRITELAGEYNIQVIPTRKSDDYPTLQQRVAFSNSAHADLFISIHVNDHRMDNDKNDYEMYISNQNNNFNSSRLLASSIVANLKSLGIDVVLNSDKHLWVLSQNEAPSVLIECGDLNNIVEMTRLNDNQQLDAFCRQVLSGIVSFQNNRR